MKRIILGLLALVILLPGGLIAYLYFVWLKRVQSTVADIQGAKGALPSGVNYGWNPAGAPLSSVLFWGKVWGTLLAIPEGLWMGIFHNEGASAPDSSGGFPIGDIGVANGPSYGPGQVERVNIAALYAKAPFFFKPFIGYGGTGNEANLANPAYVRQAVYYAIAWMKAIWVATGGDYDETGAQYNGGPHHKSQAAANYGAGVAIIASIVDGSYTGPALAPVAPPSAPTQTAVASSDTQTDSTSALEPGADTAPSDGTDGQELLASNFDPMPVGDPITAAE